jgi:hypothetical protein
MIDRFLRFPWGRLTCVIGAALCFMGVDDTPSSQPIMIAFIFAAVALHGLAIWRDKP